MGVLICHRVGRIKRLGVHVSLGSHSGTCLAMAVAGGSSTMAGDPRDPGIAGDGLSGTHGLEGAYGQVRESREGQQLVTLLADEGIPVLVKPEKLRRASACFTAQFKNFPPGLQKLCLSDLKLHFPGAFMPESGEEFTGTPVVNEGNGTHRGLG